MQILTFEKRPENIDATVQEDLAYLSETCEAFTVQSLSTEDSKVTM